MEAKNNYLEPVDILKIYARKFVRIAPAYYIMWLLMWCLTSRIANGPIWHNTNMNFETCNENWMPTLFMYGNLYPQEMIPYTGCYQFAWPLQLDMQLHLIVPFIAMAFWKSSKLGMFICTSLIISNIFINMYLTRKHDLTMGFLSSGNYFLL